MRWRSGNDVDVMGGCEVFGGGGGVPWMELGIWDEVDVWSIS